MNYDLQEVTEAEFVQKSADLLAQHIATAIEADGECIFGLSGGSTPKPVYELLGKNSDIDWGKVRIFLVDERYIEPTSDDSNQKLVRDTLLKHAEVPAENLIFPDTSLALDVCTATYMQALIDLFSNRPPDVLTLGMGDDGHIASLFPPVSENAFGEQVVLHTTTDDFAVRDRISISPLVILAAQTNVLLLKGAEKKEVFDECASQTEMDPSRWPLHIALATGSLEVVWGS